MNELHNNEYRNYYPHLKKELYYFNHAGISPISSFVKDAVLNIVDEFQSENIDNLDDYFNLLSGTRSLIGKLINATPDRIALMNNTSAGLNLLANSMEWHEGDRIILNNIEFPSNVYPFLNLQRKGVIIDYVQAENGIISLQGIKEKITKKTKLLSISHVQFYSGYKANLTEIGKICRENNIVFCVDAIQSAGATEINVVESMVDFLATGGHKWLMAPPGTGFIYITKELQDKIHQSYLSWLSVKIPMDIGNYGLELKDTAERFEYANHNHYGISGLNASIKNILKIGIPELSRIILSLTSYLIDELKKLNVNIITPLEEDNRAGIVTFANSNSTYIVGELKKKHIIVADRNKAIRVSPHYYNNYEEIDNLIFELKKII